MTMYLLLVAGAMLFASQFIFNQNFQKCRGDDVNSTLLFQIHTAFVCVLLMFVLNRFQIAITGFSVIVGTIYAVDIILYIYFSMKAFTTANLSVYSIFAMLGGMILPFLYGTVFCNEEVTIPKVVSCVFIALALGLTFEKGKNSKKCMGYYLAVFFFNGMMGVFSTIHQSNVEQCTDSRSFVAITYGVVFFLSLTWYIGRNKKLARITVKEFGFASGYAICGGIAEMFLLIALTVLPASVQYPIVTGGVILFSTIVSAIVEKQASRKSICSAVIALIATVIIIL